MFKFDIAAVISAVRSPLQFAALLAILIFLSFLILRLSPEPRSGPRCGADLACPAQEGRSPICGRARITLEYGHGVH